MVGQIGQTLQQITSSQQQLGQAQSEVSSFQTKPKLTTSQLLTTSSPLGLSQAAMTAEVKNIGLKTQALQEIGGQQEELKNFEKEYKSYLATPSGIVAAAEEGLGGKTVKYEKVSASGGSKAQGTYFYAEKDVPIITYTSPYGTFTDSSAKQIASDELMNQVINQSYNAQKANFDKQISDLAKQGYNAQFDESGKLKGFDVTVPQTMAGKGSQSIFVTPDQLQAVAAVKALATPDIKTGKTPGGMAFPTGGGAPILFPEGYVAGAKAAGLTPIGGDPFKGFTANVPALMSGKGPMTTVTVPFESVGAFAGARQAQMSNLASSTLAKPNFDVVIPGIPGAMSLSQLRSQGIPASFINLPFTIPFTSKTMQIGAAFPITPQTLAVAGKGIANLGQKALPYVGAQYAPLLLGVKPAVDTAKEFGGKAAPYVKMFGTESVSLVSGFGKEVGKSIYRGVSGTIRDVSWVGKKAAPLVAASYTPFLTGVKPAVEAVRDISARSAPIIKGAAAYESASLLAPSFLATRAPPLVAASYTPFLLGVKPAIEAAKEFSTSVPPILKRVAAYESASLLSPAFVATKVAPYTSASYAPLLLGVKPAIGAVKEIGGSLAPLIPASYAPLLLGVKPAIEASKSLAKDVGTKIFTPALPVVSAAGEQYVSGLKTKAMLVAGLGAFAIKSPTGQSAISTVRKAGVGYLAYSGAMFDPLGGYFSGISESYKITGGKPLQFAIDVPSRVFESTTSAIGKAVTAGAGILGAPEGKFFVGTYAGGKAEPKAVGIEYGQVAKIGVETAALLYAPTEATAVLGGSYLLGTNRTVPERVGGALLIVPEAAKVATKIQELKKPVAMWTGKEEITGRAANVQDISKTGFSRGQFELTVTQTRPYGSYKPYQKLLYDITATPKGALSFKPKYSLLEDVGLTKYKYAAPKIVEVTNVFKSAPVYTYRGIVLGEAPVAGYKKGAGYATAYGLSGSGKRLTIEDWQTLTPQDVRSLQEAFAAQGKLVPEGAIKNMLLSKEVSTDVVELRKIAKVSGKNVEFSFKITPQGESLFTLEKGTGTITPFQPGRTINRGASASILKPVAMEINPETGIGKALYAGTTAQKDVTLPLTSIGGKRLIIKETSLVRGFIGTGDTFGPAKDIGSSKLVSDLLISKTKISPVVKDIQSTFTRASEAAAKSVPSLSSLPKSIETGKTLESIGVTLQKTVPLAFESLKSIQIQEPSVVQKVKTVESLVIPKNMVIEKVIPELKLGTAESVVQKSAEKPVVIPKEVVTEVPKLITIEVPRISPISSTIPGRLIERPTPPPVFKIKFPAGEGKKASKTAGKSKIKKIGYEVEIRRKKKFYGLGVSLPKEEAITLGMKKVVTEAAATFRIRQTKKPVKAMGISPLPGLVGMFRPPKKFKANVYVQRTRQRITTAGEVAAISYKGAAARRKGGGAVKVRKMRWY